jgi:hypothetical protein
MVSSVWADKVPDSNRRAKSHFGMQVLDWRTRLETRIGFGSLFLGGYPGGVAGARKGF